MRIHDKSYMLYLSEEQLQFIRDEARENGVSGAEICRRLIQYAIDEKKRLCGVLDRQKAQEELDRKLQLAFVEKFEHINTDEAAREIEKRQHKGMKCSV